MIELLLFSEVNLLEVILGIIFFVISFFITFFLYQIKKFNALFFGFLFFTLWNFLEVLDEFVVKSLLRELIFNVFGRFILIVSLIIFIIALKRMPKHIYKPTKKDREKIGGVGTGIFFWALLIVMFIINFTHNSFGLSYFNWHFFLHSGIIVFSFLIVIYSLKLNKKARKYIISGSVLLILNSSILLLGHIFEGYFWVGSNLLTLFGTVLGAFIIMKGFKEAVNV